MNDFRGKTMTENISVGGCRFSEELIKKVLEEQPKLVVRHNFKGDPIGHTIGFTDNTDDSISVDIHLDETESLLHAVLPLYIVPSLVVKEGDIEEIDGVKVIKRAIVTEFSLTDKPTDKRLTPIYPIKK